MAEPAPEADTTRRTEPADAWPPGFVAFYEQRYAKAVRVARLVVGRVDIAEDLVQDAFVGLSRHWDEIDAPAAYLHRSIVNAATRQLERGRRERAYVASQRPTVVPPPDVAEILAALDVLTARRRVAIVLRFYADLPDDEIARILDCRPATVRSLVHRGLHQLAREMS